MDAIIEICDDCNYACSLSTANISEYLDTDTSGEDSRDYTIVEMLKQGRDTVHEVEEILNEYLSLVLFTTTGQRMRRSISSLNTNNNNYCYFHALINQRKVKALVSS